MIGTKRTEGPTTFALMLKFRIDSNPTGNFSSGHLRYEKMFRQWIER